MSTKYIFVEFMFLKCSKKKIKKKLHFIFYTTNLLVRIQINKGQIIHDHIVTSSIVHHHFSVHHVETAALCQPFTILITAI